jgi:hypothetical protein
LFSSSFGLDEWFLIEANTIALVRCGPLILSDQWSFTLCLLTLDTNRAQPRTGALPPTLILMAPEELLTALLLHVVVRYHHRWWELLRLRAVVN